MKLATRLPAERSLPAEDANQIAEIREQIIAVGDDFRARHPWIARYQDAIALAIFIIAVAGVVGDAVLYIEGVIPWWVCIPVTAFWLSVLHELEHDLIHRMYFRTRKWVHHSMLFWAWFLRPNTVNPWIRRRWHLHHHEVSGTESDFEERAITNGQGWDGHRLLMSLDHMLGVYTQPFRFMRLVKDYVEHEAMDPDERRRLTRVTMSALIPFGAMHAFAWHSFLGLQAFQLLGGHVAHGWAYNALTVFAVVLLAPNALRQACLVFVSSNMHYYGDVEEHNVFKQTQVWTAKRMWPFQAFCFNFGGTHAIHHFVVRDPFYLRQAIAGPCQEVLRAHGVRFNDFGTFRRANRWILAAPVEP
jgi:fatty acid desaturase